MNGLFASDDLNCVHHATAEVGEIEWCTLDLESRGRQPDDVDDLVRELGQPARLLRGAGQMLPQALVTRILDSTCGKVDRQGEGRQRRTQLVTRHGQELLLQVPQAAISDVADDD